MKATQQLHDAGQSLWLDNITRDLLDTGTLKQYIDELSVTGLTSNPTIFYHAIKKGTAYDASIAEQLRKGKSGEALFFNLAIEDLTRAADLFRPAYDKTNGVDGWVSLEVSPLLAYDTARTIAAAKDLSSRAARPNLFIKIPGTKDLCSRPNQERFSPESFAQFSRRCRAPKPITDWRRISASFSFNPLPDIGRTIFELDALVFAAPEKPDSLPIHQGQVL